MYAASSNRKPMSVVPKFTTIGPPRTEPRTTEITLPGVRPIWRNLSKNKPSRSEEIFSGIYKGALCKFMRKNKDKDGPYGPKFFKKPINYLASKNIFIEITSNTQANTLFKTNVSTPCAHLLPA